MDELIRAGLVLAALAQPADSVPPGTEVSPSSVVAQDAWLGADKFQHFWLSFAATSFTFAAATAAGQDTGGALVISIPVAAAAGIGKEIRDRRRGSFSPRDLVADALGITAAWFLLREVR